jgi:ribonuclease-3
MASGNAGAKRAAESNDLDALAARLGHRFETRALLERAVTHPSAAPRHGEGSHGYERLEFLGDRVLGLVVADLLLARFPEESEGALGRRLAELVRRETLAEVAGRLGLAGCVRLAKGERAAGERDNPAILADVCEAVLGALYLDGGLGAARAVIEPLWAPLIETAEHPPQDAKTALQEWAQGRGLPLPEYRELSRSGPAHEPIFTVEVSVAGDSSARGEGRSKRLAEQSAAGRLLARLRGAA